MHLRHTLLLLLLALPMMGSFIVGESVGGGGGGHTIEDDDNGVLTDRDTLKFIGPGITCVDNDPNTECTVAGGGSGVTIEEDDVGIGGGPHTTLNFTSPLTASDAGSSEADLGWDANLVGDATWGNDDDSSILWCWDVGPGLTSPCLTLTDGNFNFTIGTVQVNGAAVSTGAHFTAGDALDAVAAQCGDAEALLGDDGHTCLDPASQAELEAIDTCAELSGCVESAVTAAGAVDAVQAECTDTEVLLGTAVSSCIDPPTQAEFDDHSTRHESGQADELNHDNLAGVEANEHYEQRQEADCPTASGGVQNEICFDTGDGYFYYCAAASCDGSGWTQQTDGGGAEVNALESGTVQAIEDMEIAIGEGTNDAAYLLLTACAADAKPEFTNDSPNTFSCEAIGGLGSADISGLQDEDLGNGGDNDFGDFTCTGGEDGCTLDAGSVDGGSGGHITDGSVTTDDTELQLETYVANYNVENAQTSDSGNFQTHHPYPATIRRVYCSTSANTCTINLFERAEGTPNTGTTNMITTSLVCDTDGENTTTFTDAAVAENGILALGIISETLGTGDVCRVHVELTVD